MAACVALLLVGAPASAAPLEEVVTLTEVGRVPLGVLRMGDYVFVSPATAEALGVELGSAVHVRAGEHELEARLSCLDRANGEIAMRLSLREALGVQPGPAAVELWPFAADETPTVPAFAWPQGATALDGDLDRWAGVALGAPHGGCDFHTEDVARLVNELGAVPTAIYEGARFSYIGRWNDVSRPAGLRSVGGWKVATGRQCDPEFAAVYNAFQDNLLQVAGAKPLDIYIELHGHDLTGLDADKKRISREIIEGASVGFSASELQRLVARYESSSREHGRLAPPALRFFELGTPPASPGHRPSYTWRGQIFESRWAAIDTRLLGTLRPEMCLHGMQLETPNSMRFEPAEREITAYVLIDLLAEMQAIVAEQVAPDARAVEASSKNRRVPVGVEQLVRFPAGKSTVGAPKGEGLAAEHPEHEVATGAFALETTEVTAQAFAAFLQRGLDEHEVSVTRGLVLDRAGHTLARVAPAVRFSTLEFHTGRFRAKPGRGLHPAVHVSWFGAHAFAREVGLDLPTEAEWERAAASSSPAPSAAHNAGFLPATWRLETLPLTAPVASLTPTPEGLYDLGGNVWEWCSDWYDERAYSTPAALELDPMGPLEGTAHVLRGGGWRSEPFALRSSTRKFASPNTTTADIGFRCVSHLASR
jgi:formylglycine-generating enzyme required for sulfatase activity